jgi:hypothetical protein
MQDRLQATTGDKLQVVPSMNDFLGKVLKAYGKDSSKKDPSVVGKFALHLHLHALLPAWLKGSGGEHAPTAQFVQHTTPQTTYSK